MRMQELADPLAEVDIEDDSTATKEKLEKLTRTVYSQQRMPRKTRTKA